MKKITLILGLAIITFTACKDDPVVDLCDDVKYSNNIEALLTTSCNTATCHASGNSDSLPAYDVYDNIDATKITARVFTMGNMPPEGSTPLTDAQKADLKCWLDDGAPNN